MSGTLVAQENATAVASNGSTLTLPGFATSTLPPGTYVGFISNAGPNGTWNSAGTASVQVISGSVTIMGSDESGYDWNGNWVSDVGTLYLTADGLTESYSFGSTDSTTSIAAGLAAAFNSASSSPVKASSTGDVLWLYGAPGSSANLATTSFSVHNYVPGDGDFAFSGMPSFIGIAAESATGTASFNIMGSNQSSFDANGDTIWDAGAVSVNANGFSEAYSFGSSDSPESIATGLANAFNSSQSSPVTASVNGNILSLTSKSGTQTPMITSVDGGHEFGGVPPFIAIPWETITGAGSVNIVGGIEGGYDYNGNWTFDAGGVYVSANGFGENYNYGSADSPGSIASGLANAFNSATGSPVTASTNGSILTLTSKSGTAGALVISTSSYHNYVPDDGGFIFGGIPSFLAIPTGH